MKIFRKQKKEIFLVTSSKMLCFFQRYIFKVQQKYMNIWKIQDNMTRWWNHETETQTLDINTFAIEDALNNICDKFEVSREQIEFTDISESETSRNDICILWHKTKVNSNCLQSFKFNKFP